MITQKALAAALLAAFLAAPAAAQDVNFGDDSGQYPNDNECDDRRFFGPGMVAKLDWESVGKDASDCKAAYDAGRVQLWNMADARAATQCDAIRWGDDSSDYSDDGACDDPRFEGMGAAEILLTNDSGRDASDCRQLCEFGLLSLRDY